MRRFLQFSLAALALAGAFAPTANAGRSSTGQPVPTETVVITGTLSDGGTIPLPTYAGGTTVSAGGSQVCTTCQSTVPRMYGVTRMAEWFQQGLTAAPPQAKPTTSSSPPARRPEQRPCDRRAGAQ